MQCSQIAVPGSAPVVTTVKLVWLTGVLLQGLGGFSSEMPPGRYLRYAWESATPKLHSAPSESAPIARTLRGVRNRLIEYDSVRYVTIEPGYLVPLRDTRLTGRIFGNVEAISRSTYYRGETEVVDLIMAAGDTVLYLQDRADNTCFLQVGSAVVEAQPCPSGGLVDWQTIAYPQTELWIRVTTVGKPLGWVKTGAGVTKVAPRYSDVSLGTLPDSLSTVATSLGGNECLCRLPLSAALISS